VSKHILAIDIDLGNITAVSSRAGVVSHKENYTPEGLVSAIYSRIPGLDTVLIELAGPVMHHRESHSHRRWMIYNALMGARLAYSFDLGEDILVSASTQWTRGYSEEKRHAISGMLPLKYTTRTVTKKGVKTQVKSPVYAEPHDVRECRCMIDFYAKYPAAWVTVDEYLAALVEGPKK
jgi:hypothetical protein